MRHFLRFLIGFVIGLLGGIILAWLLFSGSSKEVAGLFSFSSQSDNLLLPSLESPQVEVPILMYHHIGLALETENKNKTGLDVSATDFEEQIAFLYAKGYQAISIDDLFKSSSSKNFVVTFDDGYKDVIQNAYPVLKRLDFKATVFLIVNKIGEEGYLDWQDIETLEKEGWSFGSHTLNHKNLLNLNKDSAEQEITQSKKELEVRLESPVTFFCYPIGKFDETLIKMVKGAGYQGAVTILSGKDHQASDIYKLKRIRVSGFDSLESFAEKVR